MPESPKRPADVSRADASRVVKRAKSAAPTNETARAVDSVPVAVGPFTVLPTQFGRYRIEKLLGKGAMGAVYLAHDIQLDRPVALKVARVSAAGSAKLIKRMETEAKAAARLDHPQICKVYDFGEIDGIRFIALQYIAGEDLKSYLKRVGCKREPDEAIGWIVRLASALEAAHEKGVVHRDLKPENIMLDRKYEPVIMDFGLARNMTGTTNAGLTQGMILGTAAYMSPEQAVGNSEGIDHRSDLYALGVMLFEMLTGEWPFTGSAIEVMGKKSVQEAPSPLSLNPNIPPELAAICQKLIARKKEDRYTNCAEIIAALEGVDLNAPVALEMRIEALRTPSEFAVQDGPSFAFLEGHPDVAPMFQSPPIVPKKQPSMKSMANSLVPYSHWWRDQPTGFRWTILGASSACLLLAMTIFFRNGDALVKVEVHAEDVEVTFRNETLTFADGAHQFKVKPGDQTLHIKSTNVDFDTEKFTLNRGENPAITVALVKSDIVINLGEKEVGRRRLTTSVSGEKDANATLVGNQDKVAFPLGATYEGEYKMYHPNEDTHHEHYTMRVIVASRVASSCEANWSFIQTGVGRRIEWTTEGTVNADGSGITSLKITRELIDGVQNTNLIASRFSFIAEVSDGGKRLSGKVFLPSGRRAHFESTLQDDTVASTDDRTMPNARSEEILVVKNGDFSDGLNGWEKEGAANNFGVFPLQPGSHFMTTFSKYDARGRLFQSFQVPEGASQLKFFVHGGDLPTMYVGLSENGKVVYRQTAKNSNDWYPVIWDISKLRGKQVTLEIVDQSNRNWWNHIGVYGFKVLGEAGGNQPAVSSPN